MSIHRIFALTLVYFSSGCGSERPDSPGASTSTTTGLGGGTGATTTGQASITGAGGSTSNSGGMATNGSTSASTSTTTTASTSTSTTGAVDATGGASGGATTSSSTTGSAEPCAHECLAECTGWGGVEQPGACDGAQICCQGATVPEANPLAHLKPSAEQVGLLLANRFRAQPLAFSSVADLPGDGYKVACEWYGALGVASLTGSRELLDALIAKFDPLEADFVEAMLGGEAHVDRYIFGIVPLEIYLQTADESYLSIGTETADAQQVTDQARGAIDDMFMMTSLQLQAYRATRDAKYIEFMAATMAEYLEAQQANGLFFHNVSEAPVYWGRGNGWFAAGMAEIMRDLPTDSARYQAIEVGYERMMEGLLPVQSDDGLWYQVLDMPDDPNNWEETSGSAMFTYAMIAGVRRGILDSETYVPVIESAWEGLQSRISPQGDVSEICVGTWYHDTAQDYMALDRLVGDGHGQAPVLWAAAELLR